MDKRGQAALEYLMTYGWALIVIAIVVGVLVFIVSSPGGPQCSSSDPAKIVMQSHSLTKAQAGGSILLQNITGGDITIRGVTAGTPETPYGFTETLGATINGTSMPTISATTTVSVTGGNRITIGAKHATAATSTLSNAKYTLTYIDAFQLTRSVVITCNGTVPA